MTIVNPYYCPALRMKSGELTGLRDLAPDIADYVRPRLIVPPPLERDNQFQAKLFSSDTFPNIGGALAAHWRLPILVEATYLLDEFGRDKMQAWYPRMFDHARSVGARPIPMVAVDDLIDGDLAAYRAALDNSERTQMSLVIKSGDLSDTEKLNRALDAMGTMGLSPESCVVIADFHDADFSNPEVVAPIITGVMETLQVSAPWQQIVFQGTNYPEKNPADPGGYYLVPRHEWLAWKRAITLEPENIDQLIFGDYAADCAKIDFGGKGGGAPAIRHLRYTTSDGCLVQRGPDGGTNMLAMRAVCQAILKSGVFAGRNFSSADDLIYCVAQGIGGPGGAKEWRAINTTHHITRVVNDIGGVRGLRFARKKFASSEQLSLLS